MPAADLVSNSARTEFPEWEASIEAVAPQANTHMEITRSAIMSEVSRRVQGEENRKEENSTGVESAGRCYTKDSSSLEYTNPEIYRTSQGLASNKFPKIASSTSSDTKRKIHTTMQITPIEQSTYD